MSEITDALVDTIAHDLECTLPVKRGVSFSDLAREILRLRARIAELEHPHVETGEWQNHNPWTETETMG